MSNASKVTYTFKNSITEELEYAISIVETLPGLFTVSTSDGENTYKSYPLYHAAKFLHEHYGEDIVERLDVTERTAKLAEERLTTIEQLLKTQHQLQQTITRYEERYGKVD